jgi:acetoacetyl-CoA synthetase
MWNLQLSTLAVGGSIVCYDGAPAYPDPSALWRIVSDQEVTFFGSSPGLLQATVDGGVVPRERFDLAQLRAMGSTGSPLPPHLHHWCAEAVGAIPLHSMSGGTDIAGAFCGGAPTVPIWPGELSVRCLGVAIDAWDADGHPLRRDVGEMVITKPMPSMPTHLWNDPDGQRYADTYFDMFPTAWRQGDWVTVTDRNSIVIHGRSDSTLNRHGVRMGSADIYSAIDERIPQVREALVIGAEMPDGSYWMPLFVVLEEGQVVTDDLVRRLAVVIRVGASPRHVPDEVVQVRGIPHTKTGKKLEVPVKRILQGADVASVVKPDAVDDPDLLKDFVEIAARRRNG